MEERDPTLPFRTRPLDSNRPLREIASMAIPPTNQASDEFGAAFHYPPDLLAQLMGRSGARGMIIANPGFSDAAIKQARDAMSYMTVVLVTLEEIVGVLTRGDDLVAMLRSKIQAAVIDREPFRRH